MDFVEDEAIESDEEDDELESPLKKKVKKIESSDEEEEDDEEVLREELKDLIDDNPIEDDDSDGGDSVSSRKRKKSDDEDFDDRLEDDDYDLIEENLGVKVQRKKRFKRLRQFEDDADESDGGEGVERDAIANRLFEGSDDEEGPSKVAPREDRYEGLEEDDSDEDDFIVDDEGRPITERKKKRKPIFTDAALQEAQDIFGVDFDYEDFGKWEGVSDEEEEEDYEEDDVEGERKKKAKKASRLKPTRKSIFDVYEPSELKRGHFTDIDNMIRSTDMPERMQLRDVPVTPIVEDSEEHEEEAEWIFKEVFCKPTVSTQDFKGGEDPRLGTNKGPKTVDKIKHILNFIRNDYFEVPFIAFYRKEYMLPELDVNDLWKIYKWDGKWCELKARKMALLRLLENMREYQEEEMMKDLKAPIPDDVRLVTADDIDTLKAVQTTEELKDVHDHFLLHYGPLVGKMQEKRKAKEREAVKEAARKKRLENGGDGDEDGDEDAALDKEEEDELGEEEEPIKPAQRSGSYATCVKTGLYPFSQRYGLKPEQFARNVRDNYQRHDVEQELQPPLVVAQEYACPLLKTGVEVLKAGKYMVATQISKEPLLRKALREAFYERAKVNVIPTKKGFKEIDESHACYAMKYLKDKPVRELAHADFLKLHIAEQDKLLEIKFNEDVEGLTSNSYLEEIKALYIRDEFSNVVREWNDLRVECVEHAYKKMLAPQILKDLRLQLLAEAKDYVLKQCSKKLYNWLKVAPYKVEFEDEEDDEWDTSGGVRAMGLAFANDFSQSAFACIVAPDGECTDHLRLPHLLKRRTSHIENERNLKIADLKSLRHFIELKKPHVICVGAESRDALMIMQDVKEIVQKLVEEEQFPNIPVEIVDNEFSKVYANSVRGSADFRDYPHILRQAISIARRMQDPLVEFSQLCTSDDEILCLRYHNLQEHVSQEELLEMIMREFVHRTNEVGVDLNEVVQSPFSGNLLQFVCGLGPRKAAALVKLMKQTNQRLENRTQLVTACHMGPKIFVNCAGFIKIDTNSLGDSTEAYVEVLDGSRVHPEMYECARKMATDALDTYDDEGNNPAGALEEILDAPEKLKDLDLDAFAEELKRQAYRDTSITLYNIRAELTCRYKDLRQPFASPNPDELFDLLTKETPETFYIGKMILATVAGIQRKKPKTELLDQGNPVRKDETGLWQCPFCLKSDFQELSEVWNHFDAGGCPGQAVGVRLRLDNGVSGYIHLKNLSDQQVNDPEARVKLGQMIHCRIMKIDVERFSVECTSKSSDLNDVNGEWRPMKDAHYDYESEAIDLKEDEKRRMSKMTRQSFVKRVIVHPNFQNISYRQTADFLEHSEQGDVVVRPSSKGTDHLTVTWKVANGIFQHVDVLEKNKPNNFSLGKSLWIEGEEYEDLDEIIARHIAPMAAHAADCINFKYYKEMNGAGVDKVEEVIRQETKANPNKIHYVLTASAKYPGKFLLSYYPKGRFRHEYITVTTEGFKFRQQMFDSLDALFKWFKDHYREPIPGTPRAAAAHFQKTPFTPITRPVVTPATYMQQTPSYTATPFTHMPPPPMFMPPVYNTPFTPINGPGPSPAQNWGKKAAQWAQLQ